MIMSMVSQSPDLMVDEDELRGLREQIAAGGPRLPLSEPVLDERAAKEAARKAMADLVDERAMDAGQALHTRQIVDRDGRPAGSAPTRRYRSARTASGTSATHPAIAV
jgi:hypothetical protein